MRKIISLILFSLVIFLGACTMETKSEQNTDLNGKAPDFNLPDQDGTMHKLSDYLGSYVLVYFYPKDNTPGCTIEAQEIRNNYSDFENLGVKVFGISADSVESHKNFVQGHNLPFTLLADTEKVAVKAYNADGVFVKRISYLINPEGNIVKFYPQVNPDTHANEILEDLKSMI